MARRPARVAPMLIAGAVAVVHGIEITGLISGTALASNLWRA